MTQSANPKVSIIMSVYNGERFLDEAIRSILGQSYQDYKFLIMDDGSTDSTPEILEKYSRDPRIKIVVQENRGLTASLNTLISLAKGGYIARMDADDISLPDRIQKQVDYLDNKPEVGVVGTGKWNISADDSIIDGICLPDDHQFIVSYLKKGVNPITHGTIMFRKSLAGIIEGPYRFTYGQDFDFSLRLSEVTKLGFVEEPLYRFRISSQSISSRIMSIRHLQKKLQMDFYKRRKEGLNEGDWREEEKKVFSQQDLGGDLSRKAEEYFALGRSCFNNGEFESARTFFVKSFFSCQYMLRSLFYLLISVLPGAIKKHVVGVIRKRTDSLYEYRIYL